MRKKNLNISKSTILQLWDDGLDVAGLLHVCGSSLRRVADECDTTAQNVYARLLVAGRTKDEAILRQHVPRTESSAQILKTVARHVKLQPKNMWPSWTNGKQ